MMGTIAITLLCLVCFEAEFSTDGVAAPNRDRDSYLAQTSGGSAPPVQRPPETAPPARGKAPEETGREQAPAAPTKSEPLKPFNPTEKVKADQAIDFPADI